MYLYRVGALVGFVALSWSCKTKDNDSLLRDTKYPEDESSSYGCDPTFKVKERGSRNWAEVRDACEAQLANYLVNEDVGYKHFSTTALGRHGIPLVLLRIMPDLDPETWGAPDENYARFGLFFDERHPERAYPSGLAYSPAVDPATIPAGTPNPDMMTITCGACHIARVRLESGKIDYIDGGANHQFDVNQWRAAFGRSAAKLFKSEADVQASVAKIVQIVQSKPEGYFYGKDPAVEAHEKAQRGLFTNPQFVGGFIKKFLARAPFEKVVLEKRIATSYSIDAGVNSLFGGAPGQVDAIGNSIYRVLGENFFGANATPDVIAEKAAAFKAQKFEELPPFPTPADFMSIWGQRYRTLAQWNGDLKHPFWRNLAAQLGVVGDPKNVDLGMTAPVAKMMYRLPSKPYPFNVDMDRAERGEKLFEANCSDCHSTRGTTVHKEIGTDFNKAQMINQAAAKIVVASLRATCKDPEFTAVGVKGESEKPCAVADGDILVGRFTEDKQGYAGHPLDGIWARAPYLHNGSVPTLRQLLAPGERVPQFVRGSASYDTQGVGWKWDLDQLTTLKRKDPVAAVYNTTLAGFSNKGHDKDLTVGDKTYVLDWGGPDYEDDLKDLIEYLKTL